MSQSNITPIPEETKTCGVCYVETEMKGFVQVHPERCPDHKVCKTCLTRHVEASISEHVPVRCPMCSIPIESSLASVMMMCTEVQRKQLERIYLHIAFATMKDLVYCPRVNCEGVFALLPPLPSQSPALSFAAALSQARTCRLVQCPTCTFPICAECKGEYHGQVSCAQHKQASRTTTQEQLDNWRKTHTRKCPGCAIDVEKNDGCNHMLCSQCQLGFCWDCLRSLAEHGEECVLVADALSAPALRGGRGGYRGSPRGGGRGGAPARPPPHPLDLPAGGRGGRGGRGGAYRPPQARRPTPAPAPAAPVTAAASSSAGPAPAAAERKRQQKKERAEQKPPRIVIDPKAIRRNVLD